MKKGIREIYICHTLVTKLIRLIKLHDSVFDSINPSFYSSSDHTVSINLVELLQRETFKRVKE